MSTLTPRPPSRSTARSRPSSSSASAPPLHDEPGIRWGLGHVAVIAAVLLAAALRLDQATAFGLVLVTAVVVGLSLGPVWRAALGVSSWAMFTGFAEHRFGILTFGAGDLVRLGVLVGGCLVIARVVTLERQWVHA